MNDLIERLTRLQASDYKRVGREVIELYVLRLTKEEKDQILQALEIQINENTNHRSD